jgi:Concanavalin A-like lectin/glucanases superfamily
MKRYVFLLIASLLFQTCNYNPLVEGESTSHGQVRMSIDMSLAPSEVTSLAGVFSRQGFDSVFFDFDIFEKMAQAYVEDLEQGEWMLYVTAMNNEGAVLYDGSTSVLIVSNTINSINLHLDPVSTTGGIKITVTWGSLDLLAKYTFSGNANDESGNGNHGSVYGATLTEDRFGNPNSAYMFDGVDDYISLGDNDNLRPKYLTLTAWISSTSHKSGYHNGMVIFRSRPYGYALALNYFFNDSAYIGQVSFHGYVSKENYYFYESPDTIYNTGDWFFLCLTYDGYNFKGYINGQNICQDNVFGESLIYYSPGGVSIGRDGDIPYNYYEGKIDDICLFDRALSEQEIQNLYNN